MAKKVKDTELYDILGVQPGATDIELKKAYKKKAIQYHPDKNHSPEAETMFKEVGQAYQILSDADSRAFYDKVGRAALNKRDQVAEIDPKEIFSKIFGGEAFYDYIGEISLVRDFTSTMNVVMTAEEQADMEAATLAERNGAEGSSGAAEGTTAGTGSTADTTSSPSTAPKSAGVEHANTSLAHHSSFSNNATPSSSSTDVSKDASPAGKEKKSKPKLTPEQRAQLDALEQKRQDERKARVEALQEKLLQRIRPFVEAKNPGDVNDLETKAFEARIRTEAEDLKLESFGIELLHTIAGVYIGKAGTFVKSKKFFGGGFLGRLKEKGGMVKDGWGVLGSALGVKAAMEEMERTEAKGSATPEELNALAEELSSKMLLTTWRATRFEVTTVVGTVVDNVLYEPNISKEISLRRAKAILTIGGIFKVVEADESDEERREMERLVMNAGNKKKKAEKEKEKEKAKSGWWGRPTAPARPAEPVKAEEEKPALDEQA